MQNYRVPVQLIYADDSYKVKPFFAKAASSDAAMQMIRKSALRSAQIFERGVVGVVVVSAEVIA